MKRYQNVTLILCGAVAFVSLISSNLFLFALSAAVAIILVLVWNKSKSRHSSENSHGSFSSLADNSSEPTNADLRSDCTTICRTNPTAHNAYIFNPDYIEQCRKRFISFDLETTGLSPESDRIIEISAVIFDGFEISEKFSTLVNPCRPIPVSASNVNGIYDSDVINAPKEYEAISAFCAFVGSAALSGEIVMVAHNAMFDVKFLLYALSRSGVEADICFQDTLYLSRNVNLPTENNKLCTLAKYFDIQQDQAHRACDDAIVCGRVFVRLLERKLAAHQEKFDALTIPEKDVCIWVKKILSEADCNTQLLTFNASAYLSVNCLYTVIKFKPNARRPYVLVSGRISIPEGLDTSPASKSEGEGFVRVFYQQPSDLEPIRDFIVTRYMHVYDRAKEYVSESDRRMKEAAKTTDLQICV